MKLRHTHITVSPCSTHFDSLVSFRTLLKSDSGKWESKTSKMPEWSQNSSKSRSRSMSMDWLTWIKKELFCCRPLPLGVGLRTFDTKTAAFTLTCSLWSWSNHKPVLINLKDEEEMTGEEKYSLDAYYAHLCWFKMTHYSSMIDNIHFVCTNPANPTHRKWSFVHTCWCKRLRSNELHGSTRLTWHKKVIQTHSFVKWVYPRMEGELKWDILPEAQIRFVYVVFLVFPHQRTSCQAEGLSTGQSEGLRGVWHHVTL